MGNPTEELCAKLDELGIEYEQSCIEGIAEYTHVTKWKMQAGNRCTFYEIEDGYPPYFTRMFIETPTAAQAIAATVGAGTCKDFGGIGANGEQVFHCSECGCVMSLYDRDGSNNLCTSFVHDYPRFCPECGRKVIETKEEAE